MWHNAHNTVHLKEFMMLVKSDSFKGKYVIEKGNMISSQREACLNYSKCGRCFCPFKEYLVYQNFSARTQNIKVYMLKANFRK